MRLIDVRKSPLKRVSQAVQFRPGCLRIHTMGHDCSVGKMVASVEVTNELKRRGYDAKFAATGQTGIIVEGDGYPIDCMVADFISGAAEQLVLDHQHHEIVVVEGQGSLVHPFYSGVTLASAARLPAAGPDLLLRTRPDVAAGRRRTSRCRPWPRSSN